MKKLLLTGLSLTFIILAQAQWTTTTTRVNTPYGPASIPSSTYVGFPSFTHKQSIYKNTFFKIRLLNDSIIYAKGSIKQEAGQSMLVLKKDQKGTTIRPSDTRDIVLQSKTQRDTIRVGMPYKNNWYYPITNLNDPIVLYMLMLDNGNEITYIKQGDNFVMPTRQLINDAVKGNSEAEKQATKPDYIKAVYIFNSDYRKKKK